MKYQPTENRVIVKQEEPEEVTVSGIVLPDTAQEKPQTGEVIAVGPGRTTDDGKLIPTSVKVGDIVIFAKYGGTELKEDGNEFLIIKENDILAIQK